MDTPSGCAIKSWNGTVAIIYLPSNTEQGRPATTALPSTIPRVFCTARDGSWSRNRFSFNPTKGSPSCRSLYTSGAKTAILGTTGTSGSRLAQDRKYFSPSIFHWHSRQGSTTRTAASVSTTAGYASSQSLHSSDPVES